MNLPTLANSSNQPSVISGRKLILIIGILGLILPILLIVVSISIGNCKVVHDSISAYYHTISRNIFVGTLCALSLSLLVYKGYSKFDDFLANIGAMCALGVAFFPTSVIVNDCISRGVEPSIQSYLHFASAGILFSIFAAFSLFLFTRSDKTKTPLKTKENFIYKVCGILITSSIICIFIWIMIAEDNKPPGIKNLKPVFWLETIALWSFSASWLTKSKIFSSENEN